ncbi:efflux RND transporter periplasmic adaptor subunit [Marinobacter sp.]|uniref:efflux RND transporter periplasmic adaptor subunit n=1 Tax=Marinobacter sp. TaxID=50741 RepID=UPI003A91CA1E
MLSSSFSKICSPLFAIFTVLVIAGCSEPVDPPVAAPVSVSVVVVDNSEVRPSRDFVARTAASAKADLTPRIEAEIREILFREGARVREGQVLVRLEDTRVNADLQQARAELTAARAEIESARKNLERGEEVAGKGYLSDADLDKLKDRFNAAQSRLKTAEASVQKADTNLEYSEIKAPFDGWIGRLNFDVGAVVSPASGPITRVLVTDPLYVEFQLNESDFVAFRRADNGTEEQIANRLSLQLTLPDGGRFEQPGRLDFADVQTDANTGTVAMRAAFPNPDAVLLPGLYVTLRIEEQAGDSRVLVPQSAVQETIEGQFVLLVDEQQKVIQRFIETGTRIGAMLVAESGLDTGEKVIVEGLQKVRTGVTVAPVVKQIDPVTGALTGPDNATADGGAAQ